jgi:hypothetical protein
VTVSRRTLFLAMLALVVLCAVVLPAVALAESCPTCKDLKSDSDYPGGGASLPRGFYYSVLLMVSAPFAVAGTFITRVVLARRRKRRGLALVPPREPGS